MRGRNSIGRIPYMTAAKCSMAIHGDRARQRARSINNVMSSEQQTSLVGCVQPVKTGCLQTHVTLTTSSTFNGRNGTLLVEQ